MVDRPELAQASARTRLLVAARALFAERGFDGAATREIAERARVQQGLVRHHFGGKAGLWREVVSASLQRLAGALSASVAASRGPGGEPSARWAEVLLAERELLQVIAHALLEPGERRTWLLAELSASPALTAFVTDFAHAPDDTERADRAPALLLRAITICALPAFAPAWHAARGTAFDAPSIARVVQREWGALRAAAPVARSHAIGPWSLAAAAARRARLARDS